MTRRVTWLWMSVMTLIAGCDSCNADRRVPFKLGQAQDQNGQGQTTGGQTTPPERPRFDPIESLALPPGAVEIEVDGTRVDSRPATMSSVLAYDIDGDGDRDALAVAASENGRAEILVRKRNGAAFENAPSIAVAAQDASCVVSTSKLTVFAARLASATIEWTCGAQDTPQTTVEHLLLSLGDAVQLRERMMVQKDPLYQHDAGIYGTYEMNVVWSARDADLDGRDDVIIAFEPTAPYWQNQQENRRIIEIPWLDRTAGLARDVREPDAAFTALVTEARTNFRNNQIAQAEIAAHTVIAVYDALCQNATTHPPRIRIGGDANGLSCRSRNARAVAGALIVMTRAKANDLNNAAMALASMPSGEAIDDRLARQVQRALAAMTRETPTLVEHPALSPAVAIEPPPEPPAIDPTIEGAADPSTPPTPSAPVAEPPLAPATPTPRSIIATPFGILVVTISAGPDGAPAANTVLVRPNEWTEFTVAPTDAVISPDGRKIAYVRNGQTELLTRP